MSDVVGVNPGTGECRCANDKRAQCDTPFAADVDDCVGNTCDCYFGPPLPLSSGNVPACVVNRFAEDVRGTANVDTGEGVISARLASVVYLGENVLTPCSVCGGPARRPSPTWAILAAPTAAATPRSARATAFAATTTRRSATASAAAPAISAATPG